MLAMPATRSASNIEPAVIAVVASCPRATAPAAVPTAANSPSTITARPAADADEPRPAHIGACAAGRPAPATISGAATTRTSQQHTRAATPAAQIVSHLAASTQVRRPCLASNCLMVLDPHSPPQCPPATSAISSRPGTEASMPAATCPISPGCASRLVAAAAVRAAACACAMTCPHCAVTARAQTSGIRGLASAPRALFAPPQVMSRQKPMMTSPVPHTSGLISLRSSAASSHSTCVLLSGDLQEPVLQPGPVDRHRLGDHPACGQNAVHVPAAVVL